MYQEEKKEKVLDYFSRASKLKNQWFGSEEFLSDLKIRDGAKRFKRKALGLCGRKTIKTIEEMAGLLVNTGIAGSHEEGVEIAPQLDGTGISYSSKDTNYPILIIREVFDLKGNKAYTIQAYSPPLPEGCD